MKRIVLAMVPVAALLATVWVKVEAGIRLKIDVPRREDATRTLQSVDRI